MFTLVLIIVMSGGMGADNVIVNKVHNIESIGSCDKAGERWVRNMTTRYQKPSFVCVPTK